MTSREILPAAAPDGVAAVDLDREMLAGELHDGLGQTLVSVNLLAALGARLADGRTDGDDPLRAQLDRLTALAQEAAERVRGLSNSSAPAPGASLEDMLATLAEDVRLRFQVPTRCTLPEPASLPDASAAWTRQVYLIIADTVRHLLDRTTARAVDFYAERRGEALEVAVSVERATETGDGADDGPALQLAARRTQLIGGTLRLAAVGRRVRALIRVAP
jgi:signal transduction histidine kinase